MLNPLHLPPPPHLPHILSPRSNSRLVSFWSQSLARESRFQPLVRYLCLVSHSNQNLRRHHQLHPNPC